MGRQRSHQSIFFVAMKVGGFLLASGVTTLTRTFLSEDAVNSWGWRIPFWGSLLIAPLLFFIVSNTKESKLWSERSEQKETEKLVRQSEHADRPAVVDLVSSPFRRRQLAGMIGVLSAAVGSFYMLFLWTPIYLSELRGVMKENEADALNFLVISCYIVFVLISGYLSDMFPHRMDLIRIGLPGVIIGCPVMFGLFESDSKWGYFIGQLQFAICLSFLQGSMAAWEVELWMADPTLSFTGVAIGHNVAACLFGGTMPLVATFLFYRSNGIIEYYGDTEALGPRLLPGLYISFLGCISLYCISSVTRHPHDVRTGSPEFRETIRQQCENEKFKQSQKEMKPRKQLLDLGSQTAAHGAVENSNTSAGNAAGVVPYLPPVTFNAG
jgi:Major Facilitator Superfamily